MGAGGRIPAALAVVVATVCCLTGSAAAARGNFSFTIKNDRFVKDGQPVQLISGAIHYFRVHPELWEDRLMRLKAMGLNTIETYIPWNVHEPYPGDFRWTGWEDVEGFIKLAQKIGFMVILRPGPYICAEWDFGGFPWWLGSKQLTGGVTMKLRTNDANYLNHVDRWWGTLLPRLTPLLYSNGGPVIMVQIENEFGFVGPDEQYLRHLHVLAADNLVDDVVLFSTDPPSVITKGSLGGDYSFATVDFGAGWWPLSQAFGIAKARNLPGMSPALVSEFYTGWLSWNGDPFPNTSYDKFIDYFSQVLQYNEGSGSVNLYMAHGGTNFGWWTGAQRNGAKQSGIEWYDGQRGIQSFYDSDITSYDYQAPISEAGDYGQPGSGGPNKFEGIRNAIVAHTNWTLPDPPPPPRIQAYGDVALTQQGTLLDHIPDLAPGKGIYSQVPLPMEEYGQGGGLIMYRTAVNATWLKAGATLFVGDNVADHAHILVMGQRIGSLDRNGPQSVVLTDVADKIARQFDGKNITLDIIVEAVGRVNTGVDFDLKGLINPLVLLNTEQLLGWRVFPLPLTNVNSLALPAVVPADQPAAAPGAPANANTQAPVSAVASLSAPAAAPENTGIIALGGRTELVRAIRSGNYPGSGPGLGPNPNPMASAVFAIDDSGSCGPAPSGNGTSNKVPDSSVEGPVFYRGYFSFGSQAKVDDKGHYPDTYLSIGGGKWSKGVAFINGFNLGWYWPYLGPANTMYVPGPLLKACNNEILLLEVGTKKAADAKATVTFVDKPDFSGPASGFGGSKDGAIVEGVLQSSKLKEGQAPLVDLSYYADTGVMGGHMTGML